MLSGKPGISSLSPHFGKTIITAVSNGTHPGALHATCMTITVVPISSASSGIIFSIRSTIRRLCFRRIKFSLAENILLLLLLLVVFKNFASNFPRLLFTLMIRIYSKEYGGLVLVLLSTVFGRFIWDV